MENKTQRIVLVENSELYSNNLLSKWCCDRLCDIRKNLT